MKKIGSTFVSELEASGLLGLPFSWGEDGSITFSEEITSNQRAAIISVYEAHNPTPAETPEQVIARLDGAIENHIQAVIKSLGYVSIERLAIYINSPNATWAAEANAAPLWITAIWAKALEIMKDVQDGLRNIPTEAELIDELPKFTEFLQAA